MNKFTVSSDVAQKLVDRKIKIFKDGTIDIYDYKKSIQKTKNGYEPIDKKFSIGRVGKNNLKNEIRIDNLSRSRKTLIDYARNNAHIFKSFITLTFKDNITDVEFANKCFKKYISSVRRAFPGFAYLGVPEFQKRGAVHYHILSNLVVGGELLPRQEEQEHMYNAKYWNYGFTSAFDLSDTDDKFDCAKYITKYLYKDLDNRLYGHTKILKSNNLIKPTVFELNKDDEVYDVPCQYLKIREYDGVSVAIEPKNDFAIPFVKTMYEQIKNEDLEHLEMLLCES